MTRYDSEHESTTDSQLQAAAAGAGRIVERNALAVKLAAFYAVTLCLGLLARRLLHGPTQDAIVSIGIWFTVIFAVCTAILGSVVKVMGSIQRHRHDYEQPTGF